MKPVRSQLEFELEARKQCRSLRRSRKATPARLWFEKMRQVVEDAAERPASPATDDAHLLGN